MTALKQSIDNASKKPMKKATGEKPAAKTKTAKTTKATKKKKTA